MHIQSQIERELPSRALADNGSPVYTERLRVLHVINYLGRGGTEMVVLKLIAGLGDTGFEQRVCTTRGFDPDFVRSRLPESKLSVAGTPEDRLQFPLFCLASIMRKYRPHVVHSRNWGGLEAVLAARLAGVPVVIHSEHGYELDMFEGLPLRRRLFRRASYAMADAVFAVTRELRDFHARQAWVRPQSMGVIYNGVDTQRFAPSKETRVSERRKLGLPDESFVVGSVGRLVPIKDQATLLKAAAVVAADGVDIRVLLVGSGPERHILEGFCTGSLAGRVCFAGDSDRVPELLNAMDAFALTSLGEGMSNSLLESMACGLPLLAARAGGNPEVIDEEKTGWLFAPRAVQELAGRLKLLAQNPQLRLQLGTAARARAVESFSLNRMLENYHSLYTSLAVKRGVAAAKMEPAHVRN
jgi:sugar transferase (PEP-CTERM/EpsH1 system associated)